MPRVYYADADITVTDDSVQIGRKVFPLRDLRSFEVEKSTFQVWLDAAWVVGFILLCCMIEDVLSVRFSNGTGTFPKIEISQPVFWFVALGIVIIASLVFARSTVLVRRSLRSTLYSLRLNGRYWSASPLSSPDEHYIRQLSYAVGWALYDFYTGDAGLERRQDEKELSKGEQT